MWGKIEGEFKRTIAHKTLSDIAETINPDAFVGVMTYGHRRKGDCGDIETILDLTQGGNNQISRITKDISSIGKTPLSASVRQAATTLSNHEGQSSIILITDGVETCGVDPCFLGAELDEMGISVTTHIVGFGLSEAEGHQVSCLAEDTGGRYIQASDASELSSALEEVVELSEAPPADIVIETPPKRIKAKFRAVGENGELLNNGRVFWTIKNAPSNPGGNGDIMIGNDVSFGFIPGEYILEAKHGPTLHTENIVISADADNLFEVKFLNGTVRFIPKLSESEPPMTGVFGWAVYQELENSKRKRVKQIPGDTVRFTLPPGEYFGEFQVKGLKKNFEFTIESGDKKDRDIIIDAAILRAKATNVKGIGIIKVFDSSGKLFFKEHTSGGHWFVLPEGKYKVVADFMGTSKSTDIEIKAGNDLEVEIPF